jgi:predicted dithiol-disulfide oxidoreductase (DUF899 family)
MEITFLLHCNLDRAPKGRDEDELAVPPAWIRRRDLYDDPSARGVA